MSVIRRLPRYYRFLCELENEELDKISSTKLAQIMHVTASQVRQDLNCFGGFGQQGYGYSVSQLKSEIENILGLNRRIKAVLIGAGNFGTAIATHLDFKKLGFDLIAAFEKDEKKIGGHLGKIPVLSEDELELFCGRQKPEAAVLCIPRSCVKGVLDKLYRLGIKNYWNFSHYDIGADYQDTVVENVHLSDNLMTLCYRINHQSE